MFYTIAPNATSMMPEMPEIIFLLIEKKSFERWTYLYWTKIEKWKREIPLIFPIDSFLSFSLDDDTDLSLLSIRQGSFVVSDALFLSGFYERI